MTTIKNKHPFLTLLMMIITWQTCQKIELPVIKEYPGVDSELWVHFQNFEIAAAKRGIFMDLREHGISGTIESLGAYSAIGACAYNTSAPSQVMIDDLYWNRSTFLRREFIVFHELGHCYMDLDHRDGVHHNGRCKSIMRSGLSACVDIYTFDNRTEYLDELFYE